MSESECTIDVWADQTRKLLEEFIAVVKRNEHDEYPISAPLDEWDEWFLMWDGADVEVAN